MSLRPEAALKISAGIVKQLVGEETLVTNNAFMAIWPAAATGGQEATQVIIRAVTNPIWIRPMESTLGPMANTASPGGARIFPDTEYVLPLSPVVHTLSLFAPAATLVVMRWIVGDGA